MQNLARVFIFDKAMIIVIINYKYNYIGHIIRERVFESRVGSSEEKVLP